MEVKKSDLIDCHNRIKPFIHNTPVLTSNYVNEITGCKKNWNKSIYSNAIKCS